MGNKFDKNNVNYSTYFNFIYKCKQCKLQYPQDELKNGICFICRDENDRIDKILNKIHLVNKAIKLKKLQRIKDHYLTKYILHDKM